MLADRLQGLGLVPLGVALSVRPHQQPMVMIDGFREFEQDLEQTLNGGRAEEIPAPDNPAHVLEGVVHHHRQVIGHPDIPPRQDNIASQIGLGDLKTSLAFWALPGLEKGQAANPAQGLPDIKSPCEGVSVPQAAALFVKGQAFAEEHWLIPVRSPGHHLGDLTAGSKTPVGQAGRSQPLQRRVVGGAAFGLAQQGPVPGDAQPVEILQNAALELRPASNAVYVLDPQAIDAA